MSKLTELSDRNARLVKYIDELEWRFAALIDEHNEIEEADYTEADYERGLMPGRLEVAYTRSIYKVTHDLPELSDILEYHAQA